jgi:hypothetical protein
VDVPGKRDRGRCSPPHEGLTGRAGACKILQVDKRTLRRLEERGLVKPAVREHDGVRWFDIEALHVLATKLRVRRQGRRPARGALPPGVELCSAEETCRINGWFASGLPLHEIVSRSGKTNETILYLHKQYVTPLGGKGRGGADNGLADEAGEYHPERYHPELDCEPPERSDPARGPKPAGRRPSEEHGPEPAPRAQPEPASASRASPPGVGAPPSATAPPSPPQPPVAARPAHKPFLVPASWCEDEPPPSSKTGT